MISTVVTTAAAAKTTTGNAAPFTVTMEAISNKGDKDKQNSESHLPEPPPSHH